MQLKLYEIKNEYLEAINALNEIEGLTPEILDDTLLPFKDSINVKITNIAAYIKNLEFEVDAMKQYEDNMNKKRKTLENKILGIRNYIKSNMVECGINKISSPEFNITLKSAADHVVIDDENNVFNNILPRYIRAKQILEVDKQLIKHDIDSGEKVYGAHLEKSYALTIK